LIQSTIVFKTRDAIRSLLSAKAKRKLNLMFLLSLSSALLDVLGIAILVYLFHYITINDIDESFTTLLTGALLLILSFVLKNSITNYFTKLQAKFAFDEALVQSRNVFKNIYVQDVLFFQNSETGALISDMMYVPSTFSNGVILGYITLLTELSVFILMLTFLALTSLYISLLVFLFVAPAAYFSYRSIKTKIEALGTVRNNNVKQAQDALIQGIQAHTDAVLYDREKYFENFFSAYQAKICDTDAEVFTLNSIPPRLMEVFAVLAICLIYIFNKKRGSEDSLPFDITLFVAAAFRMLPSVNRCLGSMLRIKNHWFAVEVLQRYKANNKTLQDEKPIYFSRNIILRKIEFTFGGNTICEMENFTIEKGACIGIHGDTGEGKSTFIKLLMQLIPVDKGSFTVDDMPINDENRFRYSHLFAYIRQDVFILNASLQENISLCKQEQCNMEILNEIILKLNLDKIKHLFIDFKASAGEAGSKLSGGQKKLVALARALYFDKPVIVLDEVFASLDNASVNLVMDVLQQEHSNGKTIIIVSHQKNVFKICDLVYEYKNATLSIKN
jgi:ABC-type multidrug transport system fused ATPase/permease subunit